MTIPGDAVSPPELPASLTWSQGVSLRKHLEDQVLKLRCEPVEGQGVQCGALRHGRVKLS